jgi:hypothetical protein
MPYFTKKTLTSGEQRSERDGRRNWAYDKASQESIKHVSVQFPIAGAVERKGEPPPPPRSTFIYVAVNLIDLKTKYFFLRSPWSRAKRIGSSGFLISFFFVLVRVNACGDKLR